MNCKDIGKSEKKMKQKTKRKIYKTSVNKDNKEENLPEKTVLVKSMK